MYRLFTKGTKGLVYSDGNRCYFPDKSWGTATEGFFEDLKIKVDKGTYAFITGKMIKLLPLSKEEFFSVNAYDAKKVYKVAELNGGTVFIVIFGDGSINLYGKTEHGIELLAFTVREDDNYSRRCNSIIRSFVGNASPLDIRDEARKFLLRTAKIPDKERFIVACVRILGERYYADFIGFELYDDVVIRAINKRARSVISGSTYVFTEDDILHHLDNAECGNLTMCLSIDDVTNFMLKHKISRGHGCISDACYNKRVIVHSVFALNDSVEMYGWCAKKFTMDCLDDTETCEFLERKYDEVESKLKHLAKYCPKSRYSELKWFNYKAWATLPTSIV